MTRIQINPHQLSLRPHDFFDRQMALLTSGDFAAKDFNQMTISWGSIGTMWNLPIVQVAVRPSRYTFQFMERYPDFTLTAFPPNIKNALKYLGSHSGRSGNKLAMTDLTAQAATSVGSPVYAQAELCIECRKIYYQDLDPAYFLSAEIRRQYPLPDYHRVYLGEIVAVWGEEKYAANSAAQG